MRAMAVVWWAAAALAVPVVGSDVPQLLHQAEELAPHRYEPAVLRRMIDLYQEALAQRPEDPQVLTGLAQLWYEWAVVEEDVGEERAAFGRAAELSFRALGLSGLEAAEDMGGDEFACFLASVQWGPPLLWAGDGWGQLLATINPFKAFGVVPKLRAIYVRLIELDEDYFGAGGHRSLGALVANLYGNAFARVLFGADLDDAHHHLERAASLAPGYLSNLVVYAQEYAVRAGDRALFQDLLTYVLAAPVGEWPFWNRLAKADARQLLDRAEELF
ncbi:MAG: TRAP transporter TatT component family protein [Candidatus Bipolaricaulaceae bacterium]